MNCTLLWPVQTYKGTADKWSQNDSAFSEKVWSTSMGCYIRKRCEHVEVLDQVMVNQTVYLGVMKRSLKRFIEANHESVSNVVLWPDRASAHYTVLVREWLESEKICFVPKTANPPNGPQVRPNENFLLTKTIGVQETRLNWKKEFWIVPKSTLACVLAPFSKFEEKDPQKRGRRSQNSDLIMLCYQHRFELYFVSCICNYICSSLLSNELIKVADDVKELIIYVNVERIADSFPTILNFPTLSAPVPKLPITHVFNHISALSGVIYSPTTGKNNSSI